MKSRARGRGSKEVRSKLRDSPKVAQLREENRALHKTVRALVARVERVTDSQGTSFSWFHAAAKLEETVRLRTAQYESLNLRLTRELKHRRKVELALKQAKQQAELANQSKTRFLAAASHDLRQPLNSALLFLESADEERLFEPERSLLNRARLALVSLNNLLGTLLDVARLDSGGIEPQITEFPLAELFQRLGPEFESVARALSIRLRLRPSVEWVRTDAHLLETVLRNFISNAIRYTPQGRVLIGCRRHGDALMICVHDTGMGIGPEHLEAIFQPYYQVPGGERRSGGGIGLGLSIVSRIAQLLSLKRVVKSRPGNGSMFGVIVPRAHRRSRLSAPDDSQPRDLGRTRSLNVVVIDDDADTLLGMTNVLERWRCHAITGSAPSDALSKLIAADIEPDLIITDYHLAGGLKGDQAIAEIRRELNRTPPAVIVTSDPDSTLRESLRQRGFTVLAKPLNLAKLRALVQHLAS